MHTSNRPPRFVIALAALLAAWGTAGIPKAGANTVSGSVVNGSQWLDQFSTPGNGDGHGNLIVGLWLAGMTVQGAPPLSSTLASGGLPLPAGPYAYSLGGGSLTDGTYSVMAWLDGNENGAVDDGEPRSPVATATITAGTPVAGLALTVADDYDQDGVAEWWKLYWFRNAAQPFNEAPDADPDGDGLSNLREYQLSTLVPAWATLNPASWDSDGDGMDDKWEVDHYSRTYSIGLNPTADDRAADPDGDGLSNWQEYCGVDGVPRMQFSEIKDGAYVGALTPNAPDDLNPLDIDSDFDLLIDSFEAAWYDPDSGIDPHAGAMGAYPYSGGPVDTSIARADPDQDGLSNYREQCLLLDLREGQANGSKWAWSGRLPFPYNDYYTDDGAHMRICVMDAPLSLGLTMGATIPTLANRNALRAHEWTDPTPGTGYHYADENIPPGYDTDNDWLPDGWEVEFNLDPRDDGLTSGWDNGPFGDPDGDGRMNWFEYLGQDGERDATRPYINGTGDETNPNEYNQRPDSTYRWRWYATNMPHSTLGDPRVGTGISRAETLGSALPTLSIGADKGADSDDDGLLDTEEITPGAPGAVPTSPVHSCDPFIPRSVMITSPAGIDIPDPEPERGSGIIPAGSREDLQRRDWTIECQVKFLGTNLTGQLFDFVTALGPASRVVYRLSLSDNVPILAFQHSDGRLFTLAANPLPTNQWFHLAGVWDHANLNLRLYVQGVLFQGVTVAGEGVAPLMLPATNRLALAVSPDGSFVNRLLLDEVRIWGVARSSEQIADYATQLVPQGIGDDVWLNKGSEQYYGPDDDVLVNGGSLFEGEPGTPLTNVYGNAGNYWIDNGDGQFNAAKDTLVARNEGLLEGMPGTLVADVLYNDKDKSGGFNPVALLAYYRFDDGGSTAEDFARKAKSGLIGTTREEYSFGDRGYALPTNHFAWVTNDAAPLLGAQVHGADDSDGDGMPDGWEVVHGLDPFDDGTGQASSPGAKDGPNGALGDPDGDGLQNLYEYWSGTNPQAEDSDGNGVPDAQEDYDGDGVANITEQQLGSRPDLVDTDDDGTPDNIEQGSGTSPANPLDPFLSRAVQLGGTPTDFLEVPLQARQRLTDWTIEAWVNPDSVAGGTGTILRRVVQSLTGGGSAVNYLMGVETNGAGALQMVAGYVLTDGRQYLLRGGVLPTGTWTHLAASYNSGTASLALYTNGAPLASTNGFYLTPPLNGKGAEVFLRIGEDFQGRIDEVCLWNHAQAGTDIAAGFQEIVAGNATNGLVHYFRFDDGQATTNRFPWSQFHQPQGLQDFVFTADWNAQWRHAARVHGSVTIVEPGAFIPPPALRVVVQPDAARLAGAAWSLDGGAWQGSGTTLENLDPGAHQLIFKTVTGWSTPTNETVTLTNGTLTTLTRSYAPTATLTVNIEPAGATNAGALWRIDGGAWLASGVTASNLPAGDHTLNFFDVPGWTTPTVETVPLASGDALTLTRSYSVVVGAIQALLIPDQAVSDGAQWNVDGGTWQNTGALVSNLTLTAHTVQFRAIPSWITPASQTVPLTNTTYMMVTGAYRQVTGIRVDLAPTNAVAAGAQWQLGNGPFTNSGAFQEVVAGVYTVRFSSVNGWVQPPDLVATVADQLTTRITATYLQYEVFGQPGTNAGSFVNPRGLALDANRRLYVADSGNNRIQRRDPRTGTWTAMGRYGTSAPGDLRQPCGIVLGPDGLLYVADSGNNRVQRWNPTSGVWTAWGSYGSALGQFISPMDVAVDSNLNLYVADLFNDRIQRLTNGVWSTFIGSGAVDGLVRDPRGIAFDRAGNLCVADDGTETNGLSRIQRFNAAGVFSDRLGSKLPAQGALARPAGMSFDLATNLYVAEIGDNRASVFRTSNATWSALTTTNLLGSPEDVAWDPRGKLFISDTDHHRIVLINLTADAADSAAPGVSSVTSTGTPAVVTITWTGRFGWLYAVQYAPTMLGAWNDVPGCLDLPGTNGTMSGQDTTAAGVTSRYYRVQMY